MMKHKITQRLLAYFLVTLLLFAVIIGFTFSSMFKQSTLDQSQADLKMRAETIASSLSLYMESTATSGHMGGMGKRNNLNVFLESIDAMSMGDVWIVDKDMNAIKRSHGHTDIDIKDLPKDYEVLIKNALNGSTGYANGFSELLNAESMSVGVPIYDANKAIMGAILLHSPIAGIDAVIQHGYHVLIIYIAVAMILSVGMAYYLSMRFVRPLKRMNETAHDLTAGDYSVKTGVVINDEVGELARSIDELAVQLGETQRQQERLEKVRMDFFADISHELRTPITVLRGTLEAIQDGTIPTEEQPEAVATMQQEIIHLQKLVNDLLDFSKLNAIDFSLDIESLNIYDIVTDTIRGQRQHAQEKGIHLNLKATTQSLEFEGDYSRLRQMFTIILDNAIKFSSREAEIDVEVKEREVHIKDYGIGMSQHEVAQIFERFYKNDSAINGRGNGIGLAIAKQIAQRHDIIIDVKSIKGEGTTFIFKL